VGQVPELPYQCRDESCPCQGEARLNDLDFTVKFREREHEYEALIYEDGQLADVVRGHDPVDVVRQVHEAYPFARS